MINSLLFYNSNSKIYILALDARTETYLRELNYHQIIVIDEKSLLTDAIIEIRKNRSNAEFCWTLTPILIDYCITKYRLNECVYLDADLYFFSSVDVIFDELKFSSVGIIEHRFPVELKYLEIYGKYNVQFMYFKNDFNGLTVLKDWKEKCINWCYNRLEDNKFGDQLYLDEWRNRFSNIHVITNEGAGVAPWNMKNYHIMHNNDEYFISNYKDEISKLLFFHFHGIQVYPNGLGLIKNYPSNYNFSNSIFSFYTKHLVNEENKICTYFGNSKNSLFTKFNKREHYLIYNDFKSARPRLAGSLFQWKENVDKITYNNFSKIIYKILNIFN